MTESPVRPWPLTRRFDEALAYAAWAHEGQYRKGTSIPYVSHLLGVCSIVFEDGGCEDEAIAALLHDAVEDAGGRPRARGIRERFGERVARIVEECSDTDADPKPPWKARKEAYIARAKGAVRTTSAVCPLPTRSTTPGPFSGDYRSDGPALWGRFNARCAEQLWYLDELIRAFRRPQDNALVDELARVVGELRALIAEKGDPCRALATEAAEERPEGEAR